MPMQMLAVILLIPFIKFNVPVALSMCWLSNPITMPVIYWLEYLTGSYITGSIPLNVEININWFSENMNLIFFNLYTGAITFSFLGSLTAYLILNYLWKRSVIFQKDEIKNKSLTNLK